MLFFIAARIRVKFWRKTLAENFSGKLWRKTSAEKFGGKLLRKTLAPHKFFLGGYTEFRHLANIQVYDGTMADVEISTPR
jgi:hypothetical protein